MGNSEVTIESLGRALALVPEVSFRPMMGEYYIYSRGRLFGMLSRGELFIKATSETLGLFRDATERAYPGNISACRADADWLDDPEKLGEVVLYTLASHPPPQPPIAAGLPGSRLTAWVLLAQIPWGKALAAGAVFTALYYALPYRALDAIGIHKGARAEDFAVTGLDGKEMRLSDCGGKPVFLYVWESNSQRAIDNLPLIDSLYTAYKDKQVCFMPVTITADFNCAVRAFAATMGLKYPVYNGAGHIAGQFLPQQSPKLYLIDHRGYVRHSYFPSSGDLDEISSDLVGLLRDYSGGR